METLSRAQVGDYHRTSFGTRPPNSQPTRACTARVTSFISTLPPLPACSAYTLASVNTCAVYLCENSRSWCRTPGWASWTLGLEDNRRATARAVLGIFSVCREDNDRVVILLYVLLAALLLPITTNHLLGIIWPCLSVDSELLPGAVAYTNYS